MEDAIAEFVGVTGASPEDAKRYLEMAGGQVEPAIHLFFELGGAPQAPAGTGETGGQYANLPGPSDVGVDLDDVRAAIPQFDDTLVDDRHLPREPLPEVLAAENAKPISSFSDAQESSAFGELYKAPDELNHAGDFESAQQKAKAEEKWLLVNIQKGDVFDSHKLNHVFRDEMIHEMVDASFVFWQRDYSKSQGEAFNVLYKIAEFPVVLVIDPRTGRLVKKWAGKRWFDESSAAECITEFLDSFGDKPGSKNPAAMRTPPGGPMPAALSGVPTAPLGAPGLSDGAAKRPGEAPAAAAEAKRPAVLPAMPEEPPEGPECVKVRICLASGKRVMRRFLGSDPVSVMFDFVSATTEVDVSSFDLQLTQPTRSLAEHKTVSMKDAKVHGEQIQYRAL